MSPSNQQNHEETPDFQKITELAGDMVSQEQVVRTCNRYYWAGEFCKGKDVLEVACGTGQGLGYLAGVSNKLYGGDYTFEIVQSARGYYGDRISLSQFDAQSLPYPDDCLDVVLIFEALYYVPSIEKFLQECRRVLRPGGKVLVASANKDLFDFNPSPHSFRYLGARELQQVFDEFGFDVELYGDTRVEEVSLIQKITRPVKWTLVKLNLMPRSNNTKKFLKSLIFGKLVEMPREITADYVSYRKPDGLSTDEPVRNYKVLLSVATLRDE